MSEKYKEYCMKFSNEEIRAYMVDYLISNSMNNKLIKYLSEDGDEIQFNTSEKIGTIVFDGDDENLFINFLIISLNFMLFSYIYSIQPFQLFLQNITFLNPILFSYILP